MIRLKELRKEKNLNMRQIAALLGMPYTTYVSYEKGDREPNSEVLSALANFFDCSIDYLVGRSLDRVRKDHPIAETSLDEKTPSVPEGTKDEFVESIMELSEDEVRELRTFVRFLKYKRDHDDPSEA